MNSCQKLWAKPHRVVMIEQTPMPAASTNLRVWVSTKRESGMPMTTKKSDGARPVSRPICQSLRFQDALIGWISRLITP